MTDTFILNGKKTFFQPGRVILDPAAAAALKFQHFGFPREWSEWLSVARYACANRLTIAAYDPVTQAAEYKACAVRLEKLK